MALDLTTIAIFIGLALLYPLLPGRWRGWALFVGSIVVMYWLQTPLRVRWLDFLLPTLTLVLTLGSWYLTRAEGQTLRRDDWLAAGVALLLVAGLALLRFIPAEFRLLVASRPPDPLLVIGLLVIGLLIFALLKRLPHTKLWLFLLLLVLFAVLKTEVLATALSALLRSATQQDVSQASPLDLSWLGFSYVAFRLLHTVRDRQTGLLPQLSLREYASYVMFFPAFIAGPIDRAERFVQDFRKLPELPRLDAARFVVGGTRIAVGLFKKFVISDVLALGMSLNAVNAEQATSAAGLWILLYGYALRLFFDFSGYSDIAIGLGMLFGIKLPENFDQPYTRTSITKFWQSWHITLSNWARFYVFSPLSRTLLRRKPKPSPVLIVLSTQLATMIVIGLWHGVTVNFFVWGVWHGLALFVHKQWTDRTRKLYRHLKAHPRQQRIADAAAWFVTFHYVVLGWVWFALPDFESSVHVFARLFGAG